MGEERKAHVRRVASGRRSARRRLRRADLSLPEALRHSGAPLSDGAVAAHPEAVALRSGSRKPRSRKRTVKKRPATRRRTTEAKNTNGGRKVGPRTRNGREILSRPLSSCRARGTAAEPSPAIVSHSVSRRSSSRCDPTAPRSNRPGGCGSRYSRHAPRRRSPAEVSCRSAADCPHSARS